MTRGVWLLTGGLCLTGCLDFLDGEVKDNEGDESGGSAGTGPKPPTGTGGAPTGGTSSVGGGPAGAPNGGSPAGGAPSGGSPAGGSPSGGSSSGGEPPTGGTGMGGSSAGGTDSGGTDSGGTGGAAAGMGGTGLGGATGGAGMGGAGMGGTGLGGATGGAGMGGAGMGGTGLGGATGGAGMGGAGMGGGGSGGTSCVTQELLTNGNFDSGTSGWLVYSTSSRTLVVAGSAQSSPNYLSLGVEDYAYDEAVRYVNVPLGATNVVFSYYTTVSSEDSSINIYDVMLAVVEGPSGTLSEDYYDNTSSYRHSTWTRHQVTLPSSVAGAALLIGFASETDSSLATFFNVDSVSLTAMVCE